MTVGLAVDSVSQLPPALARAWEVTVIPVTVVVDGDARPETEIDPDDFYEALARGAEVTTSQPSPGELLVGWAGLVEAGATEILSFHVGSELSGTCNAARLAAAEAPVPVTVVDTGQVSFGIACGLWSARRALVAGATAAQAVHDAEATIAGLANVFVMDGMELARRSGRLRGPAPEVSVDGVDVYAFVAGTLEVVASAPDTAGAAEAMADAVVGTGSPVRAAVGHGHRSLGPLADVLAERLGAVSSVVEVVRYRVGPSVGAFSGPGSAGAYWFPA